jgi:hypothetical protein
MAEIPVSSINNTESFIVLTPVRLIDQESVYFPGAETKADLLPALPSLSHRLHVVRMLTKVKTALLLIKC